MTKQITLRLRELVFVVQFEHAEDCEYFLEVADEIDASHERFRELIADLRKVDGYPFDDTLLRYGINPSEVDSESY